MLPTTRLALVLLLTLPQAATAAVKTTLTIGRPKTLPGLAIPLRIAIRNDGATLVLQPWAKVRVTPQNGDAFLAETEPASHPKTIVPFDVEEERLTIAARGSAELELPVKDFKHGNWARDQRLWSPGRYRLEVLLYEADNDEPIAISNPVALDVVTPTERDTRILERLKTNPSLEKELLASAPDSPYLPYILDTTSAPTTLDKIALIDSVLQKHPDTPAAPSLRYWTAILYASLSEEVFAIRDDLDQALAYAEQERRVAQALIDGDDLWGRTKGRELLDRLPTRAGYLELRKLRHR
jgi:hypothetical protein